MRSESLLRLALVLALIVAPAAALANRTPGIEIDGNYVDDNPTDIEEDWYPRHPPMSDPVGNQDDTLCATSPAPKNDITNTFAANNNEFLYMGMERLAATGQTSFFWSFDVDGNGPSQGDFVFAFCFGSGDTVTDTFVLEWDPMLGEWVQDATPPNIDFMVNQRNEYAPFGALDRHGNPGNRIDRGKFAEAMIDLSQIEGFDICAADAVSLEIQTKSSCSLSSQCKDTTGIIPFSFHPVTVDLALEQPDPCLPQLVAHANVQDGQPPYSYRWFLNGDEITDQDPSWSTSDTIRIPLPDDVCGPTEVSVIVDDSQCVTEDATMIDVNRAPEAQIATLSVGACDLSLAYDASASSDCNARDILTYVWDFDGDNRPDSRQMSGSYLYPSCGEKPVRLVVLDQQMCLSDPVRELVYANQAPTAALDVAPGECLDVSYAASARDCDLAQSSTLYQESLSQEVDFGDGVTTDVVQGEHAYPTCGMYQMIYGVTDANGCLAQDAHTINIRTEMTIQ